MAKQNKNTKSTSQSSVSDFTEASEVSNSSTNTTSTATVAAVAAAPATTTTASAVPVEPVAPETVKEIIQEIEQDAVVAEAAVAPSALDRALESLEYAEKPWYLTTKDIYQVAKDSAASIPRGKDAFDKSLQGLAVLTQKIKDTTNVNVVIDVDHSYELINDLDAILVDNLVAIDDGLDGLRSKLATQLRGLITAVVAHKQRAEALAAETQANAKEQILSRYEKALLVVQSLVDLFEERYPSAFSFARNSKELVTSKVEQGKALVDSLSQKVESYRSFSVVETILSRVQPHVHRGVALGAPYWNSTLDISRPVAKPVFDKTVTLFQAVEDKLLGNALIGKYVKTTHELTFSVLNQIKDFSIPQNVELATL